MVKKAIGLLLLIGVFILVACDSGADGEQVDVSEDMIGTWQRAGGSLENYCRFVEDGTYLCADSVGKLDDIQGFSGEFWFENGQYHDRTDVTCQEIGVYDVFLLSSGNLKYELVEDECSGRVSNIIGAFDSEGKIEWAPVQ